MTMDDNIARMVKLRKKDKEFDELVTEICSKIGSQIMKRNTEKTFQGRGSCYYEIRIKVNAVPMTGEQKRCLVKYLNDRYIENVAGDYFTIEKCWFSKRYLVKTHYLNYYPY